MIYSVYESIKLHSPGQFLSEFILKTMPSATASFICWRESFWNMPKAILRLWTVPWALYCSYNYHTYSATADVRIKHTAVIWDLPNRTE